MPRPRRLLAALVACACATVARASGGPTPPGSPLPSSCPGPEPEWLQSPWWPEDAVFRCGCGTAVNGTQAAWNDVNICAAFGDLLFATGAPQELPGNPQVPFFTFGWNLWPITGWSLAVSNVGTDYCTFQGVVCGKSATGVPPSKGDAGLFLDNTKLTGTLPMSFGALAALPDIAAVSLGNPGLTVNATALLPFAAALRMLSLAGATLAGNALPVELALMTNLKSLTLAGCGVGGTLPEEYSALVSLTGLSLGDNALTGSIPEAWAAMSSLVNLGLASNHLEGSLSASLFCSMPGLQYANLNANTFTGSIPSLSCLQLVQLDLRNNYLTGTALVRTASRS